MRFDHGEDHGIYIRMITARKQKIERKIQKSSYGMLTHWINKRYYNITDETVAMQ